MSNKDGGGPAFPLTSEVIKSVAAMLTASDLSGERRDYLLEKFGERATGMTMRDYFAAKAMQGLLANSEGVHAGSEPTEAALFSERRKSIAWDYARLCFDMADAMLKARDA